MIYFTCRKKRLAWYLDAKGWTIYQALSTLAGRLWPNMARRSGYAEIVDIELWEKSATWLIQCEMFTIELDESSMH